MRNIIFRLIKYFLLASNRLRYIFGFAQFEKYLREKRIKVHFPLKLILTILFTFRFPFFAHVHTRVECISKNVMGKKLG